MLASMSDVTRILTAIEHGDRRAAEQLLPLVYDELRKLAARRLANEKAGQTLQATALVHEAYLRLVDSDPARTWDGRGHFFAAAARPCAASSSTTPAASGRGSTAAASGAPTWTSRPWSPRSRSWTCLPSTPPSIGSPSAIRRRPDSSRSATSPG